MDVFPKFIIETDDQEGDCLIVAKCTYHKQLATDITKVKGGGWWTLDRDNSIFTLSGDSHVFGRAKIEDIAKYCKDQIGLLWDEVKRFENPHNYYVDLSKKLWDIKNILLNIYQS